jgi:hypothetical protein
MPGWNFSTSESSCLSFIISATFLADFPYPRKPGLSGTDESRTNIVLRLIGLPYESTVRASLILGYKIESMLRKVFLKPAACVIFYN